MPGGIGETEDDLLDVIDGACRRADIPSLNEGVVEAIIENAGGSPRMNKEVGKLIPAKGL